MDKLCLVIGAKIFFTAALWALPLLVLRADQLRDVLGFPMPQPPILVKLLGAAFTALLIGYGLGWSDARAGIYPATTVWVGIASNGLACLILGIGALRHDWKEWGWPARGVMWTSLILTGLITLGLVWYGPLRND